MSANDWVKVEERLPAPGKAVLVATAKNRIDTAVLQDRVNGKVVWVDEDKGRPLEVEVLFWQPLPVPPTSVAEPDPDHPPLFIVEEWERGEGSEITRVLHGEEEARQIWARDQKVGRAQPRTRTHGSQVRRWTFVEGEYRLDPTWPQVGRRSS